MCGINGILGFGIDENFRNSLKSRISSMNCAIAHRGPDGQGEYVDNGLALGHRRLSIIDLSSDGHQPMFNEDHSLILVFNGEIYNYLELIPELKACGHIFRSHSDSEVILHAYEEWGGECVQRFNGMWAFAIWDVKNHRLFASRDRLGVKPFYYLKDEIEFIFSSEIKGIASVRKLNEANLAKVHDYLRYGYRTNDGSTFFAHVFELKPGHSLTIANNQLNIFQYWQLPKGDVNDGSDASLTERFSELLEDAVRLRFRSDVPVALLQSGGLDSSAICRVVDDDIEAGRLGCESVTAFTAIFPGFENDESLKVRELIATCKHIQHIEISPDSNDLINLLPQFIAGMGEPVFNSISLVHSKIMHAVSERGIKVIINGQGADEAFAGYGPSVVGYRFLDVLLSEPWNIIGQAASARSKLGLGYNFLIAQTFKAMLGRRIASKWRASMVEGGAEVLSAGFCSRYDKYLIDNNMVLAPANLNRHLRAQIEHYGFNQILHYEDHSAMMHGVEMRSPFVDYRLMEFAFNLPDRLKLEIGVTKRIQRMAFAERLPKSIIDNHRKIGFAVPFSKWMQDPKVALYLRDLVHSKSFCERSIWYANRIQEKFDHPDIHPNFPFWRFINLELWARSYGIINL